MNLIAYAKCIYGARTCLSELPIWYNLNNKSHHRESIFPKWYAVAVPENRLFLHAGDLLFLSVRQRDGKISQILGIAVEYRQRVDRFFGEPCDRFSTALDTEQ